MTRSTATPASVSAVPRKRSASSDRSVREKAVAISDVSERLENSLWYPDWRRYNSHEYTMPNTNAPRRGFFRSMLAASGWAAAAAAPQSAQAQSNPGATHFLPAYTRAQNYRSLKQSSFDRTGGNRDYWSIKPTETLEVFNDKGTGIITHIWFTISARSGNHLKELVMRIYWDGNSK